MINIFTGAEIKLIEKSAAGENSRDKLASEN
jgi:hypothetical protein